MLTQETLTLLKQQGKNNAEIAAMYNNPHTGKKVSREWVRRLCDHWDIGTYCACGTKVLSSQKRCDECKAHLRRERYCRWKQAHEQPRSFEKRPVVDDAIGKLEAYGLSIEQNVLGKSNDPELLVGGKRIKCNAIIPVSKGHQTRLGPRLDVDAFFLSDGETWFLIPTWEIRKNYNYIGEKNPLRKYAEEEYRCAVVEGLRE